MRLKSAHLPLNFIAALALIAGCDGEAFRSSGDGIKAKKQDFIYTCAAGGNTSSANENVSGFENMEVKVRGQFCTVDLTPKPQPVLNVLFVTDFSGSMEGADPSTGASCGRLDAARAVLDAVMPANSSMGAGNEAQIQVGAVSFGESAQVNTNLIQLNAFKSSSLNAGNFCGQNGRSTNYEAAMTKAREVLASVSGPKVVYFFSDGFPTSAGTGVISNIFNQAGNRDQAKQAGITAAAALRGLPDVTLNVIYLVNNHPDFRDPLEGDPTTYLNQVAGDPNRVRVVSNARDLATQVQTLEPPKPVTLDQAQATARLVADGSGERNVKVKIRETANQPGIWEFETDSFKLISGEPGQTVVNKLIVTVNASDGSSPESVITINFTRKQ